MAKRKQRKGSQQDATIRNVRASKRRYETIGVRVRKVETRQRNLERQFETLVHALRSGLAQI